MSSEGGSRCRRNEWKKIPVAYSAARNANQNNNNNNIMSTRFQRRYRRALYTIYIRRPIIAFTIREKKCLRLPVRLFIENIARADVISATVLQTRGRGEGGNARITEHGASNTYLSVGEICSCVFCNITYTFCTLRVFYSAYSIGTCVYTTYRHKLRPVFVSPRAFIII